MSSLTRPVLGRLISGVLLVFSALSFASEPESSGRFADNDRLADFLLERINANPAYSLITDIDHARLAEEAGKDMPPARVLIWSDQEFDASVLQLNPLAAIDLPLRILIAQDQETQTTSVVANSYEYFIQRHALPDQTDIRTRYEAAISAVTEGLPSGTFRWLPLQSVEEAGVIQLRSTFSFEETEKRLLDVIKAQSDTVIFEVLDFSQRTKSVGINIAPSKLILFGGPGPGGKAMASSPILGLNAFCQKLLIREDTEGRVHIAFNDLLVIAEQQKTSPNLPLRVINKRIQKTFSEALDL